MLPKFSSECIVRLQLSRNEGVFHTRPGIYNVFVLNATKGCRLFYMKQFDQDSSDENDSLILSEASYGSTWKVEIVKE